MKKNKFQMKPKIKKDINHLLTYSFFTEIHVQPTFHS